MNLYDPVVPRSGASQEVSFRATIVVPCYNEAHRLDAAGFAAFAVEQRIALLFVDDGSTDATLGLLARVVEDLAKQGVAASVLSLPKNGGKGEAVRAGMREAMRRGADVTGYFDADLATPPEEMARLVHAVAEGPAQAALGARIALLGRRVERKAHRHYLGRAFATFASLLLSLPVYDTQCGAKAFRCSPALAAALARPFSARWAFDVELLGRLVEGTSAVPGLPVEAFIEIPLTSWRDVAGSTLRPSAFPLLGWELVKIQRALRRWRSE